MGSLLLKRTLLDNLRSRIIKLMVLVTWVEQQKAIEGNTSGVADYIDHKPEPQEYDEGSAI